MPSMVGQNVLVLVFLLLAGNPTPSATEQQAKKDDDFNRTFDAPVGIVFKLAVQTAASNWHLQTSDKDTYTPAFNTGRNMRTNVGFDMSVACIEIGGGKTRVTVHAQRRRSTQLFSWKEGNRIADTFLDKLGEALKVAPQVEQPQTAVPQTPERGNSSTAIVHFKSDPEGAEILVDGKLIGTTPSELVLAVGEHTIKFVKAGFREWERTLQVSAGGRITVSAELIPQ
jgi:hypothetical protein